MRILEYMWMRDYVDVCACVDNHFLPYPRAYKNIHTRIFIDIRAYKNIHRYSSIFLYEYLAPPPPFTTPIPPPPLASGGACLGDRGNRRVTPLWCWGRRGGGRRDQALHLKPKPQTLKP